MPRQYNGTMPEHGVTALLLPVPGADALLREVAADYPGAVRDGVPAHITVLYPFLPLSEVDDPVLDELRALFARRTAPRVEFALPEPDHGFVALRPEPLEPLRELTDAVRSRWPHLVPYGGSHGDDVDPHLTVAMDVSTSDARSIAAGIAGHLPPPAVLEQAWVTGYDGEWSVRARLPLAGRPHRGTGS